MVFHQYSTIMKKFAIIALCVASLMACDRQNPTETENTETMETQNTNEWRSVSPDEFATRPFYLFDEQWMALDVKDGDKSNAMTIAWGTIGMLWSKPVVIVYVSSDRYSKAMMDHADGFTVTAFPDEERYREALRFLGTKSGRDYDDKIAAAGLTTEFTELGNVRIAEGNLCIECEKIYADEFKAELVPADVNENFYQRMGLHSFYIGEIKSIWEKKSAY